MHEHAYVISHGDLLFLSYKPLATNGDSHPSMEASSSTSHPCQPDPSHPHTHTDPPLPNTIPLSDLSNVQEPDVDTYWNGQNGKIERKRDAVMCRHGEKGMCDYCMPVEVSERYLLRPLEDAAERIVLDLESAVRPYAHVHPLLAVRREISGRTADQTSLIPRLSSKTSLRSTCFIVISSSPSSPHTAITFRHHTLSDRFPPTLSRWDLLNMPTFRFDTHFASVSNGRSR